MVKKKRVIINGVFNWLLMVESYFGFYVNIFIFINGDDCSGFIYIVFLGLVF